jgi:hypothetical protein
MSTEPPTQPQHEPEPEGAGWGAPQPQQTEHKRWSGRKTALAAGVAVVIAAAGGVAIYAGTSASGQQQNGMGPGGGRFNGMPGGPGGAMGGEFSLLRDALHGDFVASDGNGGFVTERLQTGQITAISATSITTASKDGYTQTYTIDTGTQKSGDPKTGDTVTVIAKVNGTAATATTIGEGGFQRGGPNGQQGAGPRTRNGGRMPQPPGGTGTP